MFSLFLVEAESRLCRGREARCGGVEVWGWPGGGGRYGLVGASAHCAPHSTALLTTAARAQLSGGEVQGYSAVPLAPYRPARPCCLQQHSHHHSTAVLHLTALNRCLSSTVSRQLFINRKVLFSPPAWQQLTTAGRVGLAGKLAGAAACSSR